MKKCFIRIMDKPRIIRNIFTGKFYNDTFNICLNTEKEKNIKRIIKKLLKYEVTHVVLSKELNNNKNLINALNSYDIKIFDGRWLAKYLGIEILNYICEQKNIKKEETELAITTNEITDLTIETIKILSKQYKKLIIVTNHIEKLRKIEKTIFENEGILVIISNNKKKSLLNVPIILNMDFNKEVLNKYKVNDNATIINLEGDMRIENKRFNGIIVNDYEIIVEREEIIWRDNMEEYKNKDILESILYMKDTYSNICMKIRKNKVKIKELYGINGKIERFS